MSTRCNIVIKDDKIGGVIPLYCHFDGYISYQGVGVGEELFQHFNTKEKVSEIKYKDMIGIDSGEIEYYTAAPDDEIEPYDSIDSYMYSMKGNIMIEYIYYWDGEIWKVSEMHDVKVPDKESMYYDVQVSLYTKFLPLDKEIEDHRFKYEK